MGIFSWGQQRAYLDYASATPVCAEALEAVTNASCIYGNPGAIHAEGVAAMASLTDSREKIAHELGCKARELLFVSGGTEANNLAIIGRVEKIERSGRPLEETHWIVSAIEHPSVLECFGEVERRGGKVTFIDPDTKGRITTDALARALRPSTVFVSIGWANHEVGTLQSISQLAQVIRAYEREHGTEIIFHCDAGQAPLYKYPQVHSLGVDALSLDSGKLYGPRGIGALYLSNRVELAGLMRGGAQERGLRAGTENVALAAGFAAAMGYVASVREPEHTRLAELRMQLWHSIHDALPQAVLNGTLEHSLPHILNVSIPKVSTEYVTLALDRAGFSISTKSACREGEARESHVVQALVEAGDEKDDWRSEHTLRFSLGVETAGRDCERVAASLTEIILHLEQ